MGERARNRDWSRTHYARNEHRKEPVVAQKKWPTWMVVVAFLILIPPIVWGLSVAFNIVAAMSMGGVLLIVLIVWLFTRLKKRVGA